MTDETTTQADETATTPVNAPENDAALNEALPKDETQPEAPYVPTTGMSQGQDEEKAPATEDISKTATVVAEQEPLITVLQESVDKCIGVSRSFGSEIINKGENKALLGAIKSMMDEVKRLAYSLT